MQISIEFDPSQLSNLVAQLEGVNANVPKVMAAAINDTAQQVKTRMSTMIREKVNVKKKDIDRHLTISRANSSKPSSTVSLLKSDRIGLRYFGAKQTKAGVTYQIDKSGGRKLLRSAFAPTTGRLRGQVWMRTGAAASPPQANFRRGPTRSPRTPKAPIQKRYGPSPWGVFVKNNMDVALSGFANELLDKNLNHRVRYELLKASGEI